MKLAFYLFGLITVAAIEIKWQNMSSTEFGTHPSQQTIDQNGKIQEIENAQKVPKFHPSVVLIFFFVCSGFATIVIFKQCRSRVGQEQIQDLWFFTIMVIASGSFFCHDITYAQLDVMFALKHLSFIYTQHVFFWVFHFFKMFAVRTGHHEVFSLVEPLLHIFSSAFLIYVYTNWVESDEN